jgi:alkyldihydroxyacetonephosphate synthase
VTERRLKFWGWGYADEAVGEAEKRSLAAFYAARFGVDGFDEVPPPRADEIALPAPRLTPPAALAPLCRSDQHDRLVHALGQSFPDSVRLFARQVPHAPDVVAYPSSEAELVALLDWADAAGAAVVPFGGGSSVVGGVEPAGCERYRGVVTLDTTALARVIEVDKASRAARFQAGIRGPALEQGLAEHGLTLRHFPQSFAHSTLGGWIATRSGGHFATLYTHIDDFVESLRTVTPAGVMESRRLPGSGAGPSPDRLMLGSEGALGIITEAWMRLQDRPRFRAAAGVLFGDFLKAAAAVRAVAQSGLNPSNCRLVDATECLVTGVNDGSAHLMVLGFESADHPVEAAMARALEIVRDHGGEVEARRGEGSAVKAWRDAFLRMPYFREVLTGYGIIYDTFETAITWDRFEALHGRVMAATARAIETATGKPGLVSCRFTHVYPDGPAPYYGFHALGDRPRMLEQWRAIKRAASDAVIAEGGTITHHHAVGRDHMPWYKQQRPPLFAAALERAKAALDPNGIMNPGVLVDAG